MTPRTILSRNASLVGQSKWKLLVAAAEITHVPGDIKVEVAFEPEFEVESDVPFPPTILMNERSLRKHIFDIVSTFRSPIFPRREIRSDGEEGTVTRYAQMLVRERSQYHERIETLAPLLAYYESLIIKTQPLSNEAVAQMQKRIWQETISAEEVSGLKALLGVSKDTPLMAYIGSAGDLQMLSWGDAPTSSPTSTGENESALRGKKTALIFLDGGDMEKMELWHLALQPNEVIEEFKSGGALKSFHWWRTTPGRERIMELQASLTRVWDDKQNAARLVAPRPEMIDGIGDTFETSAERSLYIEVMDLVTELSRRGSQKGFRQCQEAVIEQNDLRWLFVEATVQRLGMGQRSTSRIDLDDMKTRLTTLIMRCDFLARTSWLTRTQREHLNEIIVQDRNDWGELRKLYRALGIKRQSALMMLVMPTGALQRFSSYDDMPSTTLIAYDGNQAIAAAVSLKMPPMQVEAQLRDPSSRLSEYLQWRFEFEPRPVELVRDWSDDSERTFLTCTTTDERLSARQKRLLARLERHYRSIDHERPWAGDVTYPPHFRELEALDEPWSEENPAFFQKINQTSEEPNVTRLMRQAKKLKDEYQDFASEGLYLQKTSVLTLHQLEHVLPCFASRPVPESDLRRALQVPSKTSIIFIDVLDGSYKTLPGTSRANTALIIADKKSTKTYMVRLEFDPPTFFQKMCSEVDFLPKFLNWRFGLDDLKPSAETSVSEVP